MLRSGKPPRRQTSKRPANPRMPAYRARLRAQGLRPVQVWVPDTTDPGFAAEARRQSLLIAGDSHERAVLAAIEQVADLGDWQA